MGVWTEKPTIKLYSQFGLKAEVIYPWNIIVLVFLQIALSTSWINYARMQYSKYYRNRGFCDEKAPKFGIV